MILLQTYQKRVLLFSKLFQTKIEEWKQKGLILYFLLPYPPELNLYSSEF